MFKYILQEIDDEINLLDDVELFNSKEDAEGAAYDLLNSYDEDDLKIKTIQVSKISQDDLEDKNDWFTYLNNEVVLVLNERS